MHLFGCPVHSFDRYQFESFVLTERTVIENFQTIATYLRSVIKIRACRKTRRPEKIERHPFQEGCIGTKISTKGEGGGGHPSRATGLECRAEALSGNCCQKWRARYTGSTVYRPRTYRFRGPISARGRTRGIRASETHQRGQRFFSSLSRIKVRSRFVHFLDRSVVSFPPGYISNFLPPRILARARFLPLLSLPPPSS